MSLGDREEAFLLEEYRQLWAYYARTLDERKNLFDWYAKAVALPAAIIGYLASAAPGSPGLANPVVTALLVLVGLVGFALFGTYAKESANAHAYIEALKRIREHMQTLEPPLKTVLIIDRLREQSGGSLRLGQITAWRSAAIAIVNSGVWGAAAGVISLPGEWQVTVAAFGGASVLLHATLYTYLYGGLSPSPIVVRMRAAISGMGKRLRSPNPR